MVVYRKTSEPRIASGVDDLEATDRRFWAKSGPSGVIATGPGVEDREPGVGAKGCSKSVDVAFFYPESIGAFVFEIWPPAEPPVLPDLEKISEKVGMATECGGQTKQAGEVPFGVEVGGRDLDADMPSDRGNRPLVEG